MYSIKTSLSKTHKLSQKNICLINHVGGRKEYINESISNFSSITKCLNQYD